MTRRWWYRVRVRDEVIGVSRELRVTASSVSEAMSAAESMAAFEDRLDVDRFRALEASALGPVLGPTEVKA